MSGNFINRRVWTRSLTIVILVAAVSAIIGGLSDNGVVKADRVYLQNSAGAVLFDHGKHSSSADSCAQCHHDLLAAEQSISCQECHGEDVVAEDYSHAGLKEIHSRNCSRCHQQSNDDQQATSCRECHPGTQPSEKQTIACSDCHDDSYSPEMIAHDEYLEISEHSCLGCHTPRSVSEVYHTNCSECHVENRPDRFTKAGGDVLCGACHLR